MRMHTRISIQRKRPRVPKREKETLFSLPISSPHFLSSLLLIPLRELPRNVSLLKQFHHPQQVGSSSCQPSWIVSFAPNSIGGVCFFSFFFVFFLSLLHLSAVPISFGILPFFPVVIYFRVLSFLSLFCCCCYLFLCYLFFVCLSFSRFFSWLFYKFCFIFSRRFHPWIFKPSFHAIIHISCHSPSLPIIPVRPSLLRPRTSPIPFLFFPFSRFLSFRASCSPLFKLS